MPYNLPTLASLNRQNHVPVRRRETSRYEIESICIHRDVRRFSGGRCPICYRNSIRRYGRTVRLPRTRPIRPRVPRLPPVRPIPRPPPIPRRPPIPITRLRRPSYNSLPLYSLGTRLPGTMIYGSGGEGCIICMQSYEKQRQCQVLPCGHKFHVKCLVKWYVKKRNCPMCRQQFD